ncbi:MULTISPECIES: hydrolase [unclassified Pseudoalteromonas]|uniref:hydrolase n=1 Tax=unclassified Pseudoalteromonas TaxID=194690 RepID=UPI000EC3BF8A|nr:MULTISPECIES: hydrolase [unclassified Pseudoalteromonas]HAG41724.1 hydrolase [Pseudoalteromonas sp.]|tara:strand:+ start:22 stop:576 length:555 start_codon:yes stop_codon:yes gene_type:complete
MVSHKNLSADNSVLLVIDIQDKLSPAISEFTDLLGWAIKIAKVSGLFKIPSIVTEQYPQGLGGTNSLLKNTLINAQTVEKTHFSACNEPAFNAVFTKLTRSQIIVIGTEAHVCVLQTCLDLIAQGFEVHVAADAVGSRNTMHKSLALEQLQQAGAIITSVESIIFQWTINAALPEFKAVLSIIK